LEQAYELIKHWVLNEEGKRVTEIMRAQNHDSSPSTHQRYNYVNQFLVGISVVTWTSDLVTGMTNCKTKNIKINGIYSMRQLRTAGHGWPAGPGRVF